MCKDSRKRQSEAAGEIAQVRYDCFEGMARSTGGS